MREQWMQQPGPPERIAQFTNLGKVTWVASRSGHTAEVFGNLLLGDSLQ
jgi:hypothetical protein